MKGSTCATALLLVAVSGHGPAAGDAGDDSNFRSPGDMSVEERMEMMATATRYNECVYNQAISRVADFEDIRHIADFALGECEGKLDAMRAFITSAGFDPRFAEAFGNRTRNRAAHRILPELAIRK